MGAVASAGFGGAGTRGEEESGYEDTANDRNDDTNIQTPSAPNLSIS
jgi:hypothetical protein